MTNLPRITEAAIRGKVTEQSYDRGVDYYQSGTVESATIRGNQLFADVQGSDGTLTRWASPSAAQTSPQLAPAPTIGAAIVSTLWLRC